MAMVAAFMSEVGLEVCRFQGQCLYSQSKQGEVRKMEIVKGLICVCVCVCVHVHVLDTVSCFRIRCAKALGIALRCIACKQDNLQKRKGYCAEV